VFILPSRSSRNAERPRPAGSPSAPMRMRCSPFRLLPALALLALLAAGCDGGTPDDFASLLADARIARQSGDFDEAIALYEAALGAEPTSVVARIELASTYLARADVDLIDLDRFALHLAEGAGAAPPPGGPPGAGGGCIYSQIPGAEPFDPRDIAEFGGLLAERDVIQLALATLDGGGEVPGGPSVIPPQLRAIDLCTGIEGGALVYDRAAALTAMRAAGLDDRQIAAALAVNAVGRLIDAYLFLNEDIPQQTTWWRLPGGAIGVCADDPDALRGQAADAVADFGEALTSLDLRAEVLALGAGDPSRELVADAIDAYEAIEGDLGPVCNAAR
jgi:tetratricopeptide (TPR) repeat protein